MVKRQNNTANSDSPDGQLKGYSVNDLALSYIKGFSEFRNLSFPTHPLHLEIEEIAGRLFPYQFDRLNEPKFSIKYPPDETIATALNRYVVEGWVRRSEHKPYHPYYKLDQFLDQLAEQLLIYGACYCSINWISHETSLKLPVLRCLPIATINVRKDKNGATCFVQQYSRIGTRHRPDLAQKKVVFEEHEIFHMEYFLGETPVRLSKKLAKLFEKLRKLQSLKTKAAAHPDDLSFVVEHARQSSWSELNQRKKLLEAKIRKTFIIPIEKTGYETSALKDFCTDFYRAYRLIEYLKYLIKFRDYILAQFNAQVVSQIATMNAMPYPPQVEYLGNHMGLQELDAIFAEFASGRISYLEMCQKLI